MIEFSVIIPVYNEGISITPLYLSLKHVMDGLGRPYEIIFINDGSKDRTLNVLQGMNNNSIELVVINLKEHRGQSLALQAGFDRAQGKIIVTMDGDLQNDPEDITKLLIKMKEGYEVVCGWRRVRHDPWKKKVASNIANYFRRIIFHETIHDAGCSLRAYTAQSIKKLKLYRQRHRFLTVLLKKGGARITEVEVKHHPRRFGKSKYGIITRIFNSIPDLCAILLQGAFKEKHETKC